MLSHLSQIEAAVERGDTKAAIRLAARWCKIDPFKALLQRAAAAELTPNAYLEMGYNLLQIREQAEAALQDFIKVANTRDENRKGSHHGSRNRQAR